ncbi:hypothetical protein FCOIX_13264 [Fusarium coicis]|nr:hypothetical protein FCOIX_13264 [Fusarium coicis]
MAGKKKAVENPEPENPVTVLRRLRRDALSNTADSDWCILGHKDEKREVEITTIKPEIQAPFILIEVGWINGERDYHERHFTERDIQLKDEKMLLSNWNGVKGKRKKGSGIKEDEVHLLKILGDLEKLDDQNNMGVQLKVQFIGHSKLRTEWWWSHGVKDAYIKMYQDWVNDSELAKNYEMS